MRPKTLLSNYFNCWNKRHEFRFNCVYACFFVFIFAFSLIWIKLPWINLMLHWNLFSCFVGSPFKYSANCEQRAKEYIEFYFSLLFILLNWKPLIIGLKLLHSSQQLQKFFHAQYILYYIVLLTLALEMWLKEQKKQQQKSVCVCVCYTL